MKLSTWARREGVHYKTALKWFHDGSLPVPARQLDTGTILVDLVVEQPAVAGEGDGGCVVYARVSSSDQSGDLDRQVGRLVDWAQGQNLVVVRVVKEVGSGLDGKRAKLMGIFADHSIGTVVVEHRDRLMRFGFEYVEAALGAQGRRILVVGDNEVDDDLVRDMTEVLTSFCARLYGRRSAKRRAENGLKAMAGAG